MNNNMQNQTAAANTAGSSKEKPRKGTVLHQGGPVRDVDKFELEKRLDAVILIDISGTMKGQECLLRDCVRQLYNEIRKDSQATRAVEIGVVVFSDYVRRLQEIVEIYRQPEDGPALHFKCSGATLTGHAVKNVLSMLDERGKKVFQKGIQSYPPILFILSDGEPYCSDIEINEENKAFLNESIAEIRKRVANKKLTVFSLKIGSNFRTDQDVLQMLTGLDTDDNVFYIEKKEEQFKRFFKWASDFLKSTSKGGTPKTFKKLEAGQSRNQKNRNV